MVVAGMYFVYIANFHSALPHHHSVLKKTAISHAVLIVAAGMFFFMTNLY
jgi:hypothetical protein